MTSHTFDTVVIGSGSSAYFAIDSLNKAGQHVAVIDERPYGGTCALRGCQPKKYLVCNAEANAMASHLVGKGIVSKPESNWEALQALKQEFLDGRSEEEVKDWQDAGVATFHGRAQLTAENQVTVGADCLTAKYIVLATGATPRISDIPGKAFIQDSEAFLNMPTLPKRILFIGGGYISFEFAHAAARMGAEVTILHRSAQPLKSFDKDMVDIVLTAGAEDGIHVVTNESPQAIEKHDGAYLVFGKTGAEYKTDLIIEATGRTPNLSALEGNLGNVEHSKQGILVNQYLQSVSNKNVYAVGDCAATAYMLAPVADEEGKTAAKNILEDNVKTVDYTHIPSAVFTIPNIGTVGLTEAEATERGLDFRVNKSLNITWASSKRIGEKHAGYKILIENKTNTIIGAHLARHNAAETINTFALAIKYKVKANELANFMWAYPTLSSDIKYMVN